MPIKAVLYFNGTWSSHKEEASFGIPTLFHYIVHNPHNSLLEMHKKCLEPHKFIFDGPGTDILDEDQGIKKYFNSLFGFMDGEFGEHCIRYNLHKALEILKDLAKQASDHTLDIYLYGWSRGAFTAWLLKNELAKLIDEKRIKVSKIHLYTLDPVPGGPTDRLKLTQYKCYADPKNVEMRSVSYCSDTGNLDLWDRFSPLKSNQPFLSAFKTPGAQIYILAGNHEDIVGHSRGHPDPRNKKRMIGDIVLWHMIANSSEISFDPKWREGIISRGQAATLSIELSTHSITRKFLSIESKATCFFGKTVDQFPIKALDDLVSELKKPDKRMYRARL